MLAGVALWMRFVMMLGQRSVVAIPVFVKCHDAPSSLHEVGDGRCARKSGNSLAPV
jgi:hypothetical protein